MKRIIFVVSTVAVITAVCVIGNIKDTVSFNGTAVGNGDKIDIKITRTVFDKIFNKMSEDMTVVGNDVHYNYTFSGKVFDMDKYYAAPVRRTNEAGLAAQGYLLFDESMNNIVIQTGEEIIFSCEKEFFDLVIK